MEFSSLRCVPLLLAVMLCLGCSNAASDPSAGTGGNSNAETPVVEDEHDHEGDDEIFWQRVGLEHGDFTIKLGHHGVHLHEGDAVEPAVSISRGGEAVADAKVFVSLASADGKTVLVEEQPTVYEPNTGDEDEEAHYTQAELDVPHDAKKVLIRYRIVLPGESEDAEFEVPVSVEAH